MFTLSQSVSFFSFSCCICTFKVACVVNLKLAFAEWFGNTNQVMQNPKAKFRQSSIISEKQVICLKNWKLWRASTTIKFNTFCWNFAQVSYWTMSTNNLRPEQNIINLEHSLVDIGKQETCAKFQLKILNSIVVAACQNFQFFRQKNWFLENNKTMYNFSYGILHYLISIIKS